MIKKLCTRTIKKLSLLSLIGPGLIVMLADTDAGSIITAAQSGASWGYRLLFLQLLLIPILFIVQEMTVRLGLVTQKGHGELIRKHYGAGWAWFSTGTLVVACFGALLTELSGMAGVGALFGVPVWLTMVLCLGTIIGMVWTGSYHAVERIAIALGCFEFAFLGIAFAAGPEPQAIATGLLSWPSGNPDFYYLAAANVGAVIMPWMVFYQQAALIEKGLTAENLRFARVETAVGAVITQMVMAAVLIAVAATIGEKDPGTPLESVQQISDSLTPFLGAQVGRVVFAFGMSGAALVATIVVSLTAAWGIGEVMGVPRSLADHPTQAPWFYGVFTLALILAGLVVTMGGNLVEISVGVEVLNAILLPVVLGFLYLLARKALPEEHRLKGIYGLIAGGVVLLTSGFGLYAGLRGFFF